jgi:hypothetical protein
MLTTTRLVLTKVKTVCFCLLVAAPCLAFAQPAHVTESIVDTLSNTELKSEEISFSFFVEQDCNMDLPSIHFVQMLSRLTPSAKTLLNSLTSTIKNKPECRIRVIGYGGSSKRYQQLSWDRVNAVIRYLVEKQGIAENRFIFSSGEEGDHKIVDLMMTSEQGPESTPAPHPNLRANSQQAAPAKSNSSSKTQAKAKAPVKKQGKKS